MPSEDTQSSLFRKIMQEYAVRRDEDLRMQRIHRNEVYSTIPECRDIDSSIADISADSVVRELSGGPDSINAVNNAKNAISELSRKKAALIASAGFPPDYLDIRYVCPDCMDTGYIGTEKCHCLKQRLINEMYRQSNILSRLKEENFDTFSFEYFSGNTLDEMKQIHRASVEFVSQFKEYYRNLLFYGNVGCGKTFLTNCIAKALLDKGFSVVYLTAVQLFDILNAHTFRSAKTPDNSASSYDDLFSCSLLIIDDLGTEILSSAVSSELFQILNSRDLKKASTIISSNLSLQQLGDNYSERSISRILGNYDIYKFEGEDIRLMKRRKNKVAST